MDVQRLAVSSELDKTAREFESRGLTSSFVGWDGRARAVFAFGDALKAGAGEVIEKLRRRGLSLWLVSGDSPGAVEAVGWQLGIERTQGQALPAEKVELLRGFRAKGHRVGMVGDGLNDAAALAEADVSFALGADSDFLCRSADVVILGRDPARLLEAFDHADLATRVIRQNLFFAFLYNALAIPLALSGFLNPILAALAMLGSSLTVVGNTLRITRRQNST
jgi:P-type E1-E2 ATPase